MNQAEKLRLLYRVTRFARTELDAVLRTMEDDPLRYDADVYCPVHEVFAQLRVALERADGQLPMPMEASV